MKIALPAARALVLLATLLLMSCVPSLHPLFTAETTVVRDEIIGAWKEKADSDDSWTFKKGENSAYTLIVADKESTSEMEARIVKLGDHFFLDLTPSTEAMRKLKVGDFFKAGLVRGHYILKAKIGSTLELTFPNAEALKKRLEANPKLLQHTFVEENQLLITAPTPELQKFFEKHAADPELWTDPGILRKQLL